MIDDTESYRRELQAELNQNAAQRVKLEAQYGKVWDKEELNAEFEVIGFAAPLVIVERRSDGVKGSVMFQHAPRFYFGFLEDRR